MVAQSTLFSIALSLSLSLFVPILLYLYLRRKEKISNRSVWIGAAVWFVSTQILESTLHFFVLKNTPILQTPLLFILYGTLTAGIFEEGGRYIAFTKYLKQQREWKDGVAYGVGHGGAESIYIGLLGGVQNLIFASMLNTGKFADLKLPKEIVDSITTALTGPFYFFLLAGVERIVALTMQIALSLVVLYAVRQKNLRYLLYAILLHAVFDAGPALFQLQQANIWIIEGILLIFGVICFVFIKKSKPYFKDA